MINYTPNKQLVETNSLSQGTKTPNKDVPSDIPQSPAIQNTKNNASSVTPSAKQSIGCPSNEESPTENLHKNSSNSTSESQNTPLVNKVSEPLTANTLTSILFGRKDSNKSTDGDVSEVEELTLKTH